VVGGIGTMFRSMTRGELPQVTELVYEARENCIGLMQKEAEAIGAQRVIGSRLHIMELAPGLIEIMAIGTAVKKAEGMAPETEVLIPQAIIMDRETVELGALQATPGLSQPHPPRQVQNPGQQLVGCVIAIVVMMVAVLLPLCIGIMSSLGNL
jgi:hypothetical protein